ncbi:DUF2075 family protein/adenylate kinase [Weissella uvarum]|uniref:DUF2075 domain-containing protein n=1 Tax=Weissella uvarum TaxID=1479233 RepID=UPI00195F4F1D|nr:DUF2075 domain-containing protein [Weissella uvarum]MBM7616534.1 DUF2075 family protein/adenylate kinase [Weissella uvarum]MCM0595005.1 DUF2075 domain-containing protein [Weissella uvarum]
MENSSIEKFNVEKLTTQQEKQLNAIEAFIQDHLYDEGPVAVGVIRGAAGTGKSVILTELFKRLQHGARTQTGPYADTKNVFTVNHPELLKVYQELAAQQPNLKKKDYQRPTSIINQAHKTGQRYDAIVVDEGHLLLSKPEPYIKFYGDNQLSELMKIAKVVIVVFDFEQVMQSKAFWSPALLDRVTASATVQNFELDLQYRVHANQAVLDWLAALGRGELRPLPEDLGAYDLRIYDRAADLYEAIKQRNAEVGLSRVMATSGFKRLGNGDHAVYMDDFCLPWDEYDPQKTPWAERPESINEVGSIYTVQGFDLNYAGVILGPPFKYDKKQQRMWIDTDEVTHREIYKKSPHLQKAGEIAQMQSDVMLHAASILMTRGIEGLYLTAADDELRQALTTLQADWKRKNASMDEKI